MPTDLVSPENDESIGLFNTQNIASYGFLKSPSVLGLRYIRRQFPVPSEITDLWLCEILANYGESKISIGLDRVYILAVRAQCW